MRRTCYSLWSDTPLQDFLKDHGVGTDLLIVHEGQPSGRAIIQTTPDGEVSLTSTSRPFIYWGVMHFTEQMGSLPRMSHGSKRWMEIHSMNLYSINVTGN
jgi:hypothetical protein